MDPFSYPCADLSVDPAAFARIASLAYELRDRNWAVLQSSTPSRPSIVFGNTSETWGMYYDSTPDERASIKLKIALANEQFPVATLRLHTGGINAQVEILREGLASVIHIDGVLLEYRQTRTLVPGAIVRIDGLDYKFRYLIGMEGLPHHARDYPTIQASGRFPTISSAEHRRTGRAVAIKYRVVPIDKLTSVASQIRLLDELTHANIASLSDWFVGRSDVNDPVREISTVTFLAPLGSLHDFIKFGQKLGELQARPVMAQLMDGLMYLHGRGIIHRNLRPENILVFHKSQGGVPSIKISGLGFAVRSGSAEVAAWAAPELLVRKYSHLSDAFSAGAVMFFLLWGRPLYNVNEGSSFDTQMQTRQSNLIGMRKQLMSSVACDLLESLTKIVMEERITSHNARHHTWLQGRRVPPPFFGYYGYNHPLVETFRNGNWKASFTSDRSEWAGIYPDPTEIFIDDSNALQDEGSDVTALQSDRPELEWQTSHDDDPLFLPEDGDKWGRHVARSSLDLLFLADHTPPATVDSPWWDQVLAELGADVQGSQGDTDAITHDGVSPAQLNVVPDHEDVGEWENIPATPNPVSSKSRRKSRVGGVRRDRRVDRVFFLLFRTEAAPKGRPLWAQTEGGPGGSPEVCSEKTSRKIRVWGGWDLMQIRLPLSR
ncbi:kinase-like protein [Punctularia strigosozonata HHB-11173 SS5]|uniref:Kinase-like protein n=1 Tax=Punctularia strigosozonata (strain HHB-11173) TaxID=741275 RepID=R7S3U8_PUNST|nr:kinase-like protein [Punctularia strigosozonata HHB-11173 SS5]EIN04534.1 kinase-like protein [Punctularia strigosozonata HHB-11173 SS5]